MQPHGQSTFSALATAYTAQAELAHQPLPSTAGRRGTFTVELPPDLACPIDLHVGVPDRLDTRDKFVILLGPVTPQRRVAYLGCATPVTRWGNLQNFANRLDSRGVTVLVDVGIQLRVGGRAPPERKTRWPS